MVDYYCLVQEPIGPYYLYIVTIEHLDVPGKRSNNVKASGPTLLESAQAASVGLRTIVDLCLERYGVLPEQPKPNNFGFRIKVNESTLENTIIIEISNQK